MSEFKSLIAGQVEMETLNLELLALTPPAMRDEVMTEVRRLEVEPSVQGAGFVRGMTHTEALHTVAERMKCTGTPYF